MQIFFDSVKRHRGITHLLLQISKLFLSPHNRVVLEWKLNGNDETLRLNYPLHKNSIIFDVGGYKGEWTEQMYKKYKCHSFVFEPVSEYAQMLQEKFKNLRTVHVYPYGLAGKDSKIPLYMADNATSQFQKGGTKIMVELIDIKKVLKEHKIQYVDVIKLNIEGGEYELLEYMIKTGLIKRFRNIQVQFHHFVKHAAKRRSAIQKALQKTHKLTYNYPFVWENWVRIE